MSLFVLTEPISYIVKIDLGNGLAPNKRRGITWTIDDTVHGTIKHNPFLWCKNSLAWYGTHLSYLSCAIDLHIGVLLQKISL